MCKNGDVAFTPKVKPEAKHQGQTHFRAARYAHNSNDTAMSIHTWDSKGLFIMDAPGCASIILLRLFTSGSPTAIPVCAIAKVCKFALTKCTETPGFACFLEVLLGLRGHGCRPFTGRTRALFQYGLLHFGLAHTLGVGLFSPDIQMYPHRLHVFVILILVPPI
jgi:hypothetical protein